MKELNWHTKCKSHHNRLFMGPPWLFCFCILCISSKCYIHCFWKKKSLLNLLKITLSLYLYGFEALANKNSKSIGTCTSRCLNSFNSILKLHVLSRRSQQAWSGHCLNGNEGNYWPMAYNCESSFIQTLFIILTNIAQALTLHPPIQCGELL